MINTEYDERGEYKVLECDCCEESVETLYEANGKQLCRKCLLKETKDDFIDTIWDEICDAFGNEYVKGFEEVNVESRS